MEDDKKQPYRDAPPCPVCEAREKLALQMRPFEKHADRRCHECGHNNWTWWPTVCTGGKHLNRAPKWWQKLFHIRTLAFICPLEDSPKHFHFECSQCSARWMMLTKSESKELWTHVDPAPKPQGPPVRYTIDGGAR